MVAASSFIYVAVADLIPQLQHRLTLRETAAQLLWLLAGLGLVVLATSQLPAVITDSDCRSSSTPIRRRSRASASGMGRPPQRSTGGEAAAGAFGD